MLCNVMLRRVPCYGCAFCASLRDTDILAMHGPMNVKTRRITTYNMTLGRVRIMLIPPSCIQFHSKKRTFLWKFERRHQQ